MIILSANHILYVARLRDSQGTKRPLEGEVLVLLGWIIWKEGFAALKEMGAAEVFVPGTPLQDTVEFVRKQISARV